MRVRRILTTLLVGCVLGTLGAGVASAQVVPTVPSPPPPPAITVQPTPMPVLVPAVQAAAPVGAQACAGAAEAFFAVGLAGALVPGVPAVLPFVPVIGAYTVVGYIESALIPPIGSLCNWF
jgi:hypothetical protein